jgi:hypothetical protein
MSFDQALIEHRAGRGIVMSASAQRPQPFPKNGVLYKNLNLAKSELAKRIGRAQGAAYSYIVRTVELERATVCFEQHGSAPNFQGGFLTLCTCKHQMRSSLDIEQWKGKWIAGFTIRCRHQGRHWLFWVADAFESHSDLWHNLPAVVRKSKSAQKNFLGDLFRLRGMIAGEDRFNAQNYFAPSRHSHRRNSCDNGWHNDIDYGYSDRYGRPSLLVGEPQLTFLWEKPLIRAPGRWLAPSGKNKEE